MRNYIERAKDFIKQVYPYLNDDCMSPWLIKSVIEKFNRTFDRKVIVRSGLSRIALITSDYVVKFDYDPDEVDSIGGCDAELDLYWQAKQEGFECWVCFVIQMEQMKWLEPNDRTHPEFGAALRRAAAEGVHVIALDCHVTPDSLRIGGPVEVRL